MLRKMWSITALQLIVCFNSSNKATLTIPATEPDDNSDSSGCSSCSHRQQLPRRGNLRMDDGKKSGSP